MQLIETKEYLLLIAGSATILGFQVNRANKAAGLIRTHTSEILEIDYQSDDCADFRSDSLLSQIDRFKDRYNYIFFAAILSLIGIALLISSVVLLKNWKNLILYIWSFCNILGLFLTLIEYGQGWITLDEEIKNTRDIIKRRRTKSGYIPDIYQKIAQEMLPEIIREMKNTFESSNNNSDQ